MSVIVSIEFNGGALQEPQNRDMVEHLCAVLGREVKSYAETHGGEGFMNPPSISVEQVTLSGLGTAAEGATTTSYTLHTARANGAWHLPEEERATT